MCYRYKYPLSWLSSEHPTFLITVKDETVVPPTHSESMLTVDRCCLVPTTMNSVLSSFSFSQSINIHFLISATHTHLHSLNSFSGMFRVGLERNIKLCVIGVSMYLWKMTFYDGEQLADIDHKRKRTETGSLGDPILYIKFLGCGRE